MKRRTLLVLLTLLPFLSLAQSLTWEECLQTAHNNYPAIKQFRMVEALRDYNVDNALKGWLPQVSIEAGANALTDILNTSERMKQMGFDMKNYMVDGLVSIKQNVYDGGQIRASQALAKAQAEVESRQLDVTLHDIDERTEQLFFGILTLDEQLKQNRLLQQDLDISATTVESLMKNGLANKADMDAICVEKLKAEQQADALSATRMSYLKMLGTFMGHDLGKDAMLVKPAMLAPIAVGAWGLGRPELAFYNSKDLLLDAERQQLNARLRPKVGLVAAGLLHTKVSSAVHNAALLGGISITWNVGALYTRKNDLHKLQVERQRNDNLRETFLFNNRLQNEEADGKIQSLRKQLGKDAQIVALRENIRLTKEKKVGLGTETVNELVRSVNDVSMARLQQSLHELLLLQTICHTHTINGMGK